MYNLDGSEYIPYRPNQWKFGLRKKGDLVSRWMSKVKRSMCDSMPHREFSTLPYCINNKAKLFESFEADCAKNHIQRKDMPRLDTFYGVWRRQFDDIKLGKVG